MNAARYADKELERGIRDRQQRRIRAALKKRRPGW